MSDIRLFRCGPQNAVELPGQTVLVEKKLQRLIEREMQVLLGVRFLASEYSTGKNHGGRIDTLGLDENGCPVLVEYKRTINDNVVNQGLYYLDWLLDHRAEFELLVQRQQGETVSRNIDWSGTRVLCIAADFSRFDLHAVGQIDRNIELIRYRWFEPDLLLLELVNAQTRKSPAAPAEAAPKETLERKPRRTKRLSFGQRFNNATPATQALYEQLREHILALGDDVTQHTLKKYVAFRRLRNFVCVVVLKQQMRVWLNLNPTKFVLEPGFTRDMSKVRHWGTGNLEVRISNQATLEKAKLLIEQSYREN